MKLARGWTDGIERFDKLYLAPVEMLTCHSCRALADSGVAEPLCERQRHGRARLAGGGRTLLPLNAKEACTLMVWPFNLNTACAIMHGMSVNEKRLISAMFCRSLTRLQGLKGGADIRLLRRH